MTSGKSAAVRPAPRQHDLDAAAPAARRRISRVLKNTLLIRRSLSASLPPATLPTSVWVARMRRIKNQTCKCLIFGASRRRAPGRRPKCREGQGWPRAADWQEAQVPRTPWATTKDGLVSREAKDGRSDRRPKMGQCRERPRMAGATDAQRWASVAGARMRRSDRTFSTSFDTTGFPRDTLN